MFKIETNKVYTFKLMSGEELVTKVLEISDDGILTIDEPISFAMAQQGLQPVPATFTGDSKQQSRLNLSACALVSEVRDDVADVYRQITTGIETPNKQIITG